MAKPWTNADGLQVKFANYWADRSNFTNRPKALKTYGAVKVLRIDYDLKLIAAGTTAYTADLNNDGTADGFDLMDTYLPANSSVLRAVMISTETAVGGTSITVGTYLQNGTAISANSLITATEGVIANFTLGKRTLGVGALVSATAGTAGVGAADAFVGVTTVGTFTAGKGVIYVDYYDPAGDVP